MPGDATKGRAIWLILYDVSRENEARYLDWFHDVHIPEKLARPGYTWSAHYEAIGADGRPAALDGAITADARGFIAIFGGTDTRTFLDPSPAQIKPTQTPLTREMMGYRIGAQSLIAAEEWRAGGGGRPRPAASYVSLTLCETSGHDEDYGAWNVQSFMPRLEALGGFEDLSKLLSTTQSAKHITIASFGSLDGARMLHTSAPADAWSGRVRDYVVHARSSPLLGRRLWPAA